MAIAPAELGFPGEAAAAWPEIALRFTLAQAGVSTAIVGTTKTSHVEGNLAALSKGPLGDDATAKLREAFRRAETAAGETWSGQT
jgi:aryl-alcohol dehydrogenase-like predicted oxidoreductase